MQKVEIGYLPQNSWRKEGYNIQIPGVILKKNSQILILR